MRQHTCVWSFTSSRSYWQSCTVDPYKVGRTSCFQWPFQKVSDLTFCCSVVSDLTFWLTKSACWTSCGLLRRNIQHLTGQNWPIVNTSLKRCCAKYVHIFHLVFLLTISFPNILASYSDKPPLIFLDLVMAPSCWNLVHRSWSGCKSKGPQS